MLKLLLLVFVFLSCQGFLLDGKTTPASHGNMLTDSHFNILMNLLIEERQVRSQNVAEIQRELLAAQSNWNNKYDNPTVCECKGETH